MVEAVNNERMLSDKVLTGGRCLIAGFPRSPHAPSMLSYTAKRRGSGLLGTANVDPQSAANSAELR
ncbi:MAG: hypothetical protein DLM70_08385 [Chloroflexi bacterium]|nr:MAG: hypothetical protein DLM70_08385 [Chloroflexota bacterium]